MSPSIPYPPVSPEFLNLDLPKFTTLDAPTIARMRTAVASPASVSETIGALPLTHSTLYIPSQDDSSHLIPTSIFTPKPTHSPSPTPPAPRPCILALHGGGMIWGDAHHTLTPFLRAASASNALLISPAYRLAPEHPFPAGLLDSYSVLLYIAQHASALNIDAARIIVGGISAGGNLAAALGLLARDRGAPPIAGLLCGCPMLDRRAGTRSQMQYGADVPGVAFSRELIAQVWDIYLGGRKEEEDDDDGSSASPNARLELELHYASPALATSLAGLPPVFVDVGTADVFRDESVSFAQRVWDEGGDAELHVWAGGNHGFEVFVPESELAVRCERARVEWMGKIVGGRM